MISSILSKSFMFSNLNEKNKKIVIDAMEIKNYNNDEFVIK